MTVLFEDADIIVAVKPAGIISQADSSGKRSMITLLEEHTGSTVYPVHRLDRETCGVMVYAKAQSAAAILSRDIAEHKFDKEYTALIHGVPEKEGIYKDLLFKDIRKNKSFVVARERRGVKKAELSFSLIKTAEIDGEAYSLVNIKLFTGRTHQIRVQFSHRKMPLAGDRKYGAKDDFKKLCLVSRKIEFNHPKTKQRLTFEIELPPDISI